MLNLRSQPIDMGYYRTRCSPPADTRVLQLLGTPAAMTASAELRACCPARFMSGEMEGLIWPYLLAELPPPVPPARDSLTAGPDAGGLDPPRWQFTGRGTSMSEARGWLALAVCGLWMAFVTLCLGLIVAVWGAPAPTPQIILMSSERRPAPVTGLHFE